MSALSVEADRALSAVDAEELVYRLLTGVETRLAHTVHVAAQAAIAALLLEEPWRSALVPAAWLHDVGYSPELSVVGFHPLDGARYLARTGWPGEVCRLVAWHSAAGTEAGLRDLGGVLAEEFRRPPALAAAALAWADLTSSPSGYLVRPEDRCAEILERYEPSSVVHEAVTIARPDLLAAAADIDRRLEHGQSR